MECNFIAVALAIITMATLAWDIVGGSNSRNLNELLNNSLNDGSIPPGYETENSTLVTVQFMIQNVYNLQESDMDYEVDMFVRQKWQDDRIRHNSSTDKLQMDYKQIEQVWVPDTFFANGKRGTIHMVTVPNKMMHIYRDGTVFYSLHVAMKLTCNMKLERFPLDSQQCPMVIESYSYTDDVVAFQWNKDAPIVLREGIEMPKFYFTDKPATKRCESTYAGVGTFSCIKADIFLQRKIGYFVLQLFVPSILIVGLSWVSFWIDHESVPARISLGLLTVLTMTTQSSSFKDILPQVSYVKAIDVWTASCLIFVFLALLEYAYVNSVARYKLIKASKINKNDNQNGDDTEKVKVPPKLSNAQQAERVDKISRVIFPACFLVFNIVFWVYYTI